MVLYRSPEIQFHSSDLGQTSKNDFDLWYMYISM